jgi:hypothetical protein
MADRLSTPDPTSALCAVVPLWSIPFFVAFVNPSPDFYHNGTKDTKDEENF